MAADSATTASPWYETLKGIAGNEAVLVRSSSIKATKSNSRKISPAESSPGDNNEAGAVKNPMSPEASSTDQSTSSFSFYSGLQLAVAPKSSEAPLDDQGTAASQPTKETASAPPLPPAGPQHGAQPPAHPLLHTLPPPPADSSPVSTKKELQYPSVRDFEYQTRPEDTYYPSGKYSYDQLGPDRKPRRCWNCCCWFFSISFLIVTVFAIGVAVTAVKMSPKSPSLVVGADQIAVTSLNFTQGIANGSAQLETGMNFPFNLSNPNKYAQVIYRQISATYFYKELSLNNVTIPGFVQGKRTTTPVLADLSQLKVTIVPPDAVAGLQAEVASSDVQIVLQCSAAGSFEILGRTMKHFFVNVYCRLDVKPGDVGLPADILHKSCYYA